MKSLFLLDIIIIPPETTEVLEDAISAGDGLITVAVALVLLAAGSIATTLYVKNKKSHK